MNDYEQIQARLVSYLLTEYPADSPLQLLDTVLRTYLERTHNRQYVNELWEKFGGQFKSGVLDEFNRRINDEACLRFELIGDLGEKIRGVAATRRPPPVVQFQDALHALTPAEFETLSAVLLRIAGCVNVWVTPKSHDEGLDAFGYLGFFETRHLIRWMGCKPEVIFLAQAKHYLKEKVTSHDIREFYGSCELAKRHIYSVQGNKYRTLDFRIASPVAMVYITSGEVSIAAKTLVQNAGIVLLASQEIFALFSNYWSKTRKRLPTSTREITSQLRRELAGVESAA